MTLIEQMVRSPRLPQYVRELEDILDAERRKRRKFFDEIREDQKAEFINGEVIMHSPVGLKHNAVAIRLLRLISSYVEQNSLGVVGNEKLLVSLTRNDYEPDICYFAPDKAKKFKPDQNKFPAPDLIVEVLSKSTERFDRSIKFDDYAAHGVSEYWIVDPRKKTIEQYLLSGGRYELALKIEDGVIQSRAIKGFEIAARAVFDARENLKALAAIMAKQS
ncbi:MAG TPA: Uma2 family endonuclease [Tepidisphaeraceae bacterium]|nr:Uma2 family endonuclease [Tepidisphaeraceae bacterium]